ncbi:UDP-glucose 4-epimerase GalE [Cytobacillus purgationiresistens]|uniref:UDP-glucose 4-epimerase n=1 Tax=Cytobacillus purgationiresistens TaxID=863449 RepID=A0ABU0AIR9_9BACI|nr:UDP-glucose 4-epimerase GalE [Cytobacillus purgationiresistens]MDQ0270930.1 UDP-glucose 4-epimerase [Cytobacillus purgationiresistens]
MAILITGGAGYIGSHACVEFLNNGYEIIVVDSFINSKSEALNRVKELTGKNFKVYEVDLCNTNALEMVFAENDIEAVIHFAGLKAVGESVKVPLYYYQNNIIGTVILTHMMQKYDVKKLVFSSSATVYGPTDQMPIREDAPLQAMNPYGRTKWMIEEILGDLYHSDPSWSIAILRYFNPIGAHESGRIGEDPNGVPNNLMPYISQVAIGKLKELSVYGNHYPTHDGTGVRDYIHVVDLVQGHVKALEKIQVTEGIKLYNLGTGRGYSVLEVIHAFEKATNIHIPYKITEQRPGDTALCYANPDKAKEELGWTAEKKLEEMCEDAWRWQQLNPDGYQPISNEQVQEKSSFTFINGDFFMHK